MPPAALRELRVKAAIKQAKQAVTDIPMYIGGRQVTTNGNWKYAPRMSINTCWPLFLRAM